MSSILSDWSAIAAIASAALGIGTAVLVYVPRHWAHVCDLRRRVAQLEQENNQLRAQKQSLEQQLEQAQAQLNEFRRSHASPSLAAGGRVF
jgi:cell division protein FtsB